MSLVFTARSFSYLVGSVIGGLLLERLQNTCLMLTAAMYLVAIGSFGIMQAKLADMYTALQSSRAYVYRIAEDYDAGKRSRIDPAACLLQASSSAVKVALETIQSLGGNGYINQYPAGRLLRDAKLYEIGAGTNEIRRMLIGRELLSL